MAQNNNNNNNNNTSLQLSDEEAALYDRQLRLWGASTQARMKNSRILFLGFRSGLSAEICKNLVLAGIGSVTIQDDGVVEIEDLSSQFFFTVQDQGLPRHEAGLERIRELNNRVKVQSESKKLKDLDIEFFKNFEAVIVTGRQPKAELIRINEICKKLLVWFYIAECIGYHGYFFCDLNNHHFQTEKGEKMIIKSPTLAEVFNIPWNRPNLRRCSKLFFALQVREEYQESKSGAPLEADSLIQFKNQVLEKKELSTTFLPDDLLCQLCVFDQAELSPVCAVIGGLIGQEIIKLLSGKDEPIMNFFAYNAMEGPGIVENLDCSVVKDE